MSPKEVILSLDIGRKDVCNFRQTKTSIISTEVHEQFDSVWRNVINYAADTFPLALSHGAEDIVAKLKPPCSPYCN